MAKLRASFGQTVQGLPSTFWWLWWGTLVNRAGAFALVFLAFFLTDELGYSPAFTGLVLGAYGLGNIGATLLGGVLTDRIGRRPVLLGAQVSTALVLLALAETQGRWGLLLLVTLFGLVGNMSRPAYTAMMADIVAPPDRLRAFSLHYWAVNLGFAVAPVLAGLLAGLGYQLLFYVDAATTLVFAVLVFLRVPESRPQRDENAQAASGTMRDVLQDRVFMAFTLLTFGFALIFMQHMSTLPVQMGEDGLTPAEYGKVIALNGLLIVLVTVPLTTWLQRFASATVLAVAMLFIGVGFALTAFARTPAEYAATVAVWTIGEVIGAAVGPTVVAALSPLHMRGRYQGVFGFSFGAAALIGPLLGGWVYDVFGGYALWLGCGAVGAATALGHLLIAPARRSRLAELEAAPV